MLAFHAKHYRPDQLTVVVAGPQSLDELQSWVLPRFAPMKARPFPQDPLSGVKAVEKLIEQAASDAPPYSYEQIVVNKQEVPFQSPWKPSLQVGAWPVLLTTRPLKSVRRLAMMFPLPPTHIDPDKAPSSVLSHLLGHEGPNSSFAVLQNLGLISSLSAGPRSSGPDYTLFQIDVGLTEKGENEWEKVVDVILQHCRLIAVAAKDETTGQELRRIWGESAKLRSMFFHQASPTSVYDIAPRLSASIVKHGTKHSLCAGSMLEESEDTFPSEQVADFASQLVLSNCIIERYSQHAWSEMEKLNAEGNPDVEQKTELWYGVDYYLSKIPPHYIAGWDSDGGVHSFVSARDQLALPRPNRFIPRTLDLCPELPEEAKAGPRIDKSIDPPNLLVDDASMGRLWHRLDDRYALPKSTVSILVRNPAVHHCQKNGTWQADTVSSGCSVLLSGIFAEAMAQDTYDADLAGLHWSVSLSKAGIQFDFAGFSDRLADLAVYIVEEFLKGEFISESFFVSSKDRVLRSLRTYFESRRADSHAMYYRDFLISSFEDGVEQSISNTEETTLQSILDYHRKIINCEKTTVDCLFMGNISEKQARLLFKNATEILKRYSLVGKSARSDLWIPDALERRLPPSDIELHFASRNTHEENGAVLVTYQSPIPGFRGEGLSSEESLRSSSSIRLLTHMLREPLFDELRTKQTLGYIVSSYYDVAFSSQPDHGVYPRDNSCVPVDYIVINILSRKVSPPEVAKRIDDFLISFRESLATMPDSQLTHHAVALSTKLLKPIQNISTEAANRFAKIRHFAPEVLQSAAKRAIPWDNAPAVARAIQSLTRADLLETWDRMMLPNSRSRIVSCVYGTTFPLPKGMESIVNLAEGSKSLIVNDVDRIVAFRQHLPIYDKYVVPASFGNIRATTVKIMNPVPRLPLPSQRIVLALTAAAIFGAAGLSFLSRSRKGMGNDHK